MSADDVAESRLQPTVEEQLDQTLALVRDVLGPDLAGAYLHGSLVLGGLRPRSDLDLFVVSKRPMTREEKRRLVDGLMLISGSDSPGGQWPIELTIVVESESSALALSAQVRLSVWRMAAPTVPEWRRRAVADDNER